MVNNLSVCGLFIVTGIIFYRLYIKVAILEYGQRPRKKFEFLYFALFNGIIVYGVYLFMLQIQGISVAAFIAVVCLLNFMFGILYMSLNTNDGLICVIFFTIHTLLAVYYTSYTALIANALIYYVWQIQFPPALSALLIYILACRVAIYLATEGIGNIGRWLKASFSCDRYVILSILVCVAILGLNLISLIYSGSYIDSLAVILCFIYTKWAGTHFELLLPGNAYECE